MQPESWDDLRHSDVVHPTVLSWEQVTEIRNLASHWSATRHELADLYGVSYSEIGNIVRGDIRTDPEATYRAKPNYTQSDVNRQANAFLNRKPSPSMSYAGYAARRGYDAWFVAAHEARIAPPLRVMCIVCPACHELYPDDRPHGCHERRVA